MKGSSSTVLSYMALKRLHERTFAALEPAHVNRAPTPELMARVTVAINNVLPSYISRLYGDQLIGASVFVMLTPEQLLALTDEVVQAGVYITNGQELAVMVAKAEGMRVNTRSKADGILFCQIACNGQHLGDVIRTLFYFYDGHRRPAIKSEQDAYNLLNADMQGKFSDAWIRNAARLFWENRDNLQPVMGQLLRATGQTAEQASGKLSESMCTCAHCNTIGPSFKRCAACKTVYYCNATCQRAHWPAHKQTCCKRNKRVHVVYSLMPGAAMRARLRDMKWRA
jgi:hypothetical protein